MTEMTDIEFAKMLSELRNGLQACIEAIDGFLNYLGKQVGAIVVKEETFNILTFDKQQGAKIGEYEVAYKEKNLPDKWVYAFNILKQNNATINNRYHGEGYAFSYWLYGENKIYRQKLKQEAK